LSRSNPQRNNDAGQAVQQNGYGQDESVDIAVGAAAEMQGANEEDEFTVRDYLQAGQAEDQGGKYLQAEKQDQGFAHAAMKFTQSRLFHDPSLRQKIAYSVAKDHVGARRSPRGNRSASPDASSVFRTTAFNKLNGLFWQLDNFPVQGGKKQGLPMGDDLLSIRCPAQVKIHVVGGLSLGKIQMDFYEYLVLQFCRGEEMGVHIDHGNQVLFRKPFHVFKGEQLPGLGSPLQIIQVIDDAEHIRVTNGDDSLLNKRFHISTILLLARSTLGGALGDIIIAILPITRNTLYLRHVTKTVQVLRP
jgi:hypothetical protein